MDIKQELKKLTKEEWETFLDWVLLFGVPWKDWKDWKDGLQWPQGLPGIWLIWPTGWKGDKWDKGDKWEQWPQGIQGFQWVKWDKWERWDKWFDWLNWKDWINGRDAIVEIQFSIDGKDWKDYQPEWTKYLRYIVNGKCSTIDFTKIIK